MGAYARQKPHRTGDNSLSEQAAFTELAADMTQPSAHVLCNGTGHNPHPGRAAFTKQVHGVAQSSAHVLCNRTRHNPHTEPAACAKQVRGIGQPLAHVLHNGTRHNPHSEQTISQGKPVVSHIYRPLLARAILMCNRTAPKALSGRAADTKQVRGIAQLPAHVLRNRTKHNPHTELAACTKQGMTSHIHWLNRRDRVENCTWRQK